MSSLPHPVSGVSQVRIVGTPITLESPQGQYLQQQVSTPPINSNAVTQFIAATDPTAGVDVSFGLTDTTGIGSITLLRAAVEDPAQAVNLQSWQPVVGNYVWSDTDKALKAQGEAWYWLRLDPANKQGTSVTVGPQYLLLNPSLVAPVAATAISASHAAAANGAVLVTCNVAGIGFGESVKISVTGYMGNPNPVFVAQHSAAPLQFNLEATGETVTLTAINVSAGGTPAASGPTCTLTLNSSATAPAAVENIAVAQIAAGNQVTWPASIEAGVTSYKIYRGQRGDLFASASLLATVTASGVGTLEYLDTGGLGGDYQYFVLAVAASGTSAASPAAYPPVLYSSSSLPGNSTSNTTNTATIDSVDGGSSAVVRIYGPGGVGTSYTRLTGYGSVTRPNGSISGLAYTTLYFVLYNTANQTYLATTSYPNTLPDAYEWVGQLTTTAATGTSGSGATATAVIDSGGHVIQINPTATGSGYVSATVSIAGGGGSGAQANANVVGGSVTSYTVTNGGSGYATAPTVTVVPGSAGGTTGGGGTSGSTGGSRIAAVA